jgi:hypothetical protein
LGQSGLRVGVLSGEGYVREIAAFLLDHKRLCGVPRTTRVALAQPWLEKKADLKADFLLLRKTERFLRPWLSAGPCALVTA